MIPQPERSFIEYGGTSDGLRILELIMAIYESIETGKEVTVRFMPKQCKLGQK